MDQKSVFISYRRSTGKHLARAIYQDLNMHGWDVFLDVTTIDSGDFDRIILNQIGARAHFILLVSPDSLERCANAGDWVLREIEEAVRLERNIVPIIEDGVDFQQQVDYLPDALRDVVSRKNGLPLHPFYFDSGMEALRTRFLKTAESIRLHAVSSTDHAEVRRRLAAVEAESSARPQSLDLLPAPFDWINIPAGQVTLADWDGDAVSSSTTVNVQAFEIAKYPITNAQYAKFVEAGGYHERKWWTAEGWQARNAGWYYTNESWQPSGMAWTTPIHWGAAPWNGPDQPVVGVSWYEAVAFCLWLSDVTGESIMLPTDRQWQFAASGSRGLPYPWGRWNGSLCNNSAGVIRYFTSKQTTPVWQYEGKGNSPFGVVDMTGNVWEWCLTDYDTHADDPNRTADKRVLHGGSFDSIYAYFFLNHYKMARPPHGRGCIIGFRIARHL
jgi:formylglycine-generating enzyme required for sulfatase activity